MVKKPETARKPRRRKLAPVVALPGCTRPEDALSRLNELLSNQRPKGIIVITLEENGDVDARVFGTLERQHVTWAAARLMIDAAMMEASE